MKYVIAGSGAVGGSIGAFLAYALRRWKWCAPLPPILANTVIVPFILIYGYGLVIEGLSTLQCYGYYCLSVGAGEVISCGILGMLLFSVLHKYKNRIF